MVEKKIYNEFKTLGKNKNKKQIILVHTSRNFPEYLTGLRERNIGYFKRIPNFVITRNGDVHQFIEPNYYTRFFNSEKLNKNSIIVSLENLGWLEKKSIKNEYNNWINDIYNGEVYEKKWRNYIYWEPYTNEQLNTLVHLCKDLTDEFSIDKKCIGHNTKTKDFEKYDGIITRSNIHQDFTDVSPAFNFETFLKKLENEQFV